MKQISLDQNLIDYTDQATWDLMCEGDTVGVFQLESRLGRKTSREAKPTNIEELSDIGAALRPGCTQSKLADGKSLTYHYIERKNNREAVEYVHPALEPILKSTYAVPLFQESIIEIGIKLGNMTVAQADLYLRYAIGKKKASLIEEGKDLFLKGCVKNGIGEKDANLIFSWIQASGRYGFNKCLDPNSTIITRNGSKPLREIIAGDFILAPNGYDYDNPHKFVKVLDVMRSGKQYLFQVLFTDNSSIICSLKHKLLCWDYKLRPLSEIFERPTYVRMTNNSVSAIHSITYIGFRESMDLEVDSLEHIFYANNIAVSNSHSVAYAQHGYVTAFYKAHYPKEFYTIYLKHCKHRGVKKDEDKRILIQDARKHDIIVHPYDIRHNNKEYAIIDEKIRVGFIDLKGCSSNTWDKWQKWRETQEVPATWDEFLIYCLGCFDKTSMESLIFAGALDFYRISRKKMHYQYGVYNRLNEAQQRFAQDNYAGSILAILTQIISLGSGKGKPCYNKPSLTKIEAAIKDWQDEAYNTWTTAREIERREIDIIGAPLTCSRFDDSDDTYMSNISCLNLSNATTSNQTFKVMCWLTNVRHIKTKKGDAMAFVGFSDGEFDMEDGVVFPQAYELYHYNLIEDMEVLLIGKKKDHSFIIEKVVEI